MKKIDVFQNETVGDVRRYHGTNVLVFRDWVNRDWTPEERGNLKDLVMMCPITPYYKKLEFPLARGEIRLNNYIYSTWCCVALPVDMVKDFEKISTISKRDLEKIHRAFQNWVSGKELPKKLQGKCGPTGVYRGQKRDNVLASLAMNHLQMVRMNDLRELMYKYTHELEQKGK